MQDMQECWVENKRLNTQSFLLVLHVGNARA